MANQGQSPISNGKGRVAKKNMVRYQGRRTTPKQAAFVQKVAAGTPAYKAALEVYNTEDPNVANAIAVENLQKPTLRAALESALAKAGITLDKAIEPIQEALSYDDGDTRASLEMRLKGSDRALKLMGATSKDDDANTPMSVHFHNHVTEQRNLYNL